MGPGLTQVSLGRGEDVETAVLGAGPAGLTAAYVLALRGKDAAVFDVELVT